MGAPEVVLKSSQFRQEREQAWRELEELVGRVEKRGIRSLSAAELNRLPSLYRGAVSSLSVALAISLDRNLVDYLTALAGRAYVCVYAARRRAGEEISRFFGVQLPAEVRRHALFFAAAVLILALGTLTGWSLTLSDPERYYSFVAEEYASGRDPAASTRELRAALYDSEGGLLSLLMAFASFLFTHNAKIGILCFALGFAAGVPVLFLLFTNGLLLGAMAALYQSRGLGGEFWAWVLPHGVTELAAVCLCGAAGMVLGTSLVFPGPHTRLQNLGLRGRRASLLAIGAVLMFLIAGLLEGFFRQLVHDVAVRWIVAAATLLFWAWYFLLAGRDRESGDHD